jgi:hypothetical protein
VIVDLIAANSSGMQAFMRGRKGYTYGKSGVMEWDSLTGYHAMEAFHSHQTQYILSMARKDLEKRGFIVSELGLRVGNAPCTLPEKKICQDYYRQSCKCEYHGIFLEWRLEIGDPAREDMRSEDQTAIYRL